MVKMIRKKRKVVNKNKVSVMNKSFTFLKEVFLQIKKINWPSFGDSLRYTAIVILVSIVSAIFLGGVDFGITSFLNRLILK